MGSEEKARTKTVFNIRGSRKTTIALAVVLIIAIAGIAAWVAMSDKSPRQAYLKAESQNFKKYSQQIKNGYKDFYESQKPFIENSYRKRMEYTTDITSDSESPFGIKNAGNILGVLRRSKLIVDFNSNPVANQSQTKLSLLVERTPFLDVQAYTNVTKLGFTVPVLLPNKYFTVDLDRADEVYKRFDISLRPKRFPKVVDVAKVIDFNEESFDASAKEYGTLLMDSIKESDVEYGNKVTMEINGEKKAGREVIVKLDSQETKALATKLAEKIAGDEVLLEMTYGNFAVAAAILDEAGLFHVHKFLDELGYLRLNDILIRYIDNLNVKKDTAAFKGELAAYINKAVFPDGMDMTVVLDGSGRILYRSFNVAIGTGSVETMKISLHTGTHDPKAESLLKGFAEIYANIESDAGAKQLLGWSIDTNIDSNLKNRDKKGKVEFKHIRKIKDSDEFAIDAAFNIDSSTDEATLKQLTKTDYDISFIGTDTELKDRFFGELTNESWKNDKHKTRNSNSTLIMKFDLPTLDLKNTVVKLDIKKEDRYGTEFKIPAVREQDSIDLNAVTDQDLANIKGDIHRSFGIFYLQNKPIFDALMGQE